MQIIAGSRENYPAVNAIFPAVKHYFFLQNVFKCCQKIVIYLFHLFTPSNLGIACQRHARVGLRPKYPPIIARFPPVKNFSYIPETVVTSASRSRGLNIICDINIHAEHFKGSSTLRLTGESYFIPDYGACFSYYVSFCLQVMTT